MSTGARVAAQRGLSVKTDEPTDAEKVQALLGMQDAGTPTSPTSPKSRVRSCTL